MCNAIVQAIAVSWNLLGPSSVMGALHHPFRCTNILKSFKNNFHYGLHVNICKSGYEGVDSISEK